MNHLRSGVKEIRHPLIGSVSVVVPYIGELPITREYRSPESTNTGECRSPESADHRSNDH